MPRTAKALVAMDRRSNDRREDSDRRVEEQPVAEENRGQERRKVQRRRQIDPTTCERDYSLDEIEFMQAMDAYKRANGRMFPTCSEILEVIRDLGYRKPGSEELEPEVVESETASLDDEPESLFDDNI